MIHATPRVLHVAGHVAVFVPVGLADPPYCCCASTPAIPAFGTYGKDVADIDPGYDGIPSSVVLLNKVPSQATFSSGYPSDGVNAPTVEFIDPLLL